MKKILILGAGTAGTMMANKLERALSSEGWSITVVDEHKTHYYQPGFLFIPFGLYSQKDVEKPKRDFLPTGVKVFFSAIEVIEPEDFRDRIIEVYKSVRRIYAIKNDSPK